MEQFTNEGKDMNERIKQLAEQAGYTPDMFGVGHWDMPECKKFAELIVRECCQVLSKETIRHDGYGYNQHALYQKIREHFGVEE